MSVGEWVCFWVFLILGAFNLWLLGASVWDYFRDKRKIRAVGRPKPVVVNAIAENCRYRHERRAEDRVKWDSDFYRLEHKDDLAWAWDRTISGRIRVYDSADWHV